MMNYGLKIGMLTFYGLMLRHAVKVYREERRADARHILLGAVLMVGGAVVALLGEYALHDGRMPPLWHLVYDAIGNGLMLAVIYQSTALTLELTAPADKVPQKRFTRRWLFFGWLIMMGLYVPFRLKGAPLYFYAYNGVRWVVFVGFIGRSVLWYHHHAKRTKDVRTKHRMNLMKSAHFVCMLLPLTVLPYPESYSPRPNLVIALTAGILFYLGYVMPKGFQRLLSAFSSTPFEEPLRPYLALVGIISDFYHHIPTDQYLLEYWLLRFGNYLRFQSEQIDLLVRASYLLNSGRLHDPSALSEGSETLVSVRQRSADFAGELLGFRDIEHVLRYVHERWDGMGYPEGLSMQEIPVESRVLGLMDVFVDELYFVEDASAALEVVKAEDGAFDPQLVAALEEMVSTSSTRRISASR